MSDIEADMRQLAKDAGAANLRDVGAKCKRAAAEIARLREAMNTKYWDGVKRENARLREDKADLERKLGVAVEEIHALHGLLAAYRTSRRPSDRVIQRAIDAAEATDAAGILKGGE